MKTPLNVLVAASLSSLVAISYSTSGKATEKTDTRTIEQPDAQGNDFYRAVGKLKGALTCTGAFIAPYDKPQAPAYVLTNGHCAVNPFKSQSANLITLDTPVDYTIDFNYFHDSQEQKITVHIESVVYSTMKGMDIAILKTDKTIAQLRQQGLEPFRLSDTAPWVGEEIVVSGIPIRVNALQNTLCTSGRQVDVVENNWHWYGMLSNACAGISNGSSGSPVFNANRKIVGIINTTSRDAVGETCYNGNPCEVTDLGPKVTPEQNYAVPTQGLLACFDPSGVFSMTANGCNLPTPSGIEVQNYPAIYASENKPDNKTWSFSIQSSVDHVRIKKIKLETTNDSCQNITGYGAPVEASHVQPHAQMLPTRDEGVHQYCVIAGQDEVAKNPEVIQVLIDNTAPTSKPEVRIHTGHDSFEITPFFEVPEYTDYDVGWTADASQNCTGVNYRPFMRVPLIAPSSTVKVCVYGYDLADNKSAAFEYLIPPKLPIKE